MNLRTTDINELEAVFGVASTIPDEEKALCKALTGSEFSAEEFVIALAETVGDAPYQYIFWAGEKAVAVGGFLAQRPGVYRTWFMAPEWAWAEHGRALTEQCKAMIQQMLDGGLAHRIETVTLADKAKARAWYERIGLAYETTHRGYGVGGEDAVVYVALRPPEKV